MSLIDDLKRHEGLRLKPYDCTAGKLTIGYGRNLDDVGITEREAEAMLLSDIGKTERALAAALDWFDDLPTKAQDVLVNMGFNLGVPGLLKFTNTLKAMREGRWNDAADGMLASKWAKQVGNRATELAAIIRGLA
jgi:lysozyme